MSSCNDDVVFISLLRRRNNIGGNSVFDDRLNANVRDHLVASSNARNERFPVQPRNICARNVRSLRTARRTKGARDGLSVDVVVDDGTDSASCTSQCDLQAEVARPSQDECDVAFDSGREVGLWVEW